jgi:hypothetical protein
MANLNHLDLLINENNFNAFIVERFSCDSDMLISPKPDPDPFASSSKGWARPQHKDVASMKWVLSKQGNQWPFDEHTGTFRFICTWNSDQQMTCSALFQMCIRSRWCRCSVRVLATCHAFCHSAKQSSLCIYHWRQFLEFVATHDNHIKQLFINTIGVNGRVITFVGRPAHNSPNLPDNFQPNISFLFNIRPHKHMIGKESSLISNLEVASYSRIDENRIQRQNTASGVRTDLFSSAITKATRDRCESRHSVYYHRQSMKLDQQGDRKAYHVTE